MNSLRRSVCRRGQSPGGFRLALPALLLGLLTAHAIAGDWPLEIGARNTRTLRPLLGVNAGPYPVGEPGNADLTTQYRQSGVTMVRNHDFYGPLDMAEMYPLHTANPNIPSSYNFVESDKRFKAIIDAGLTPYFRLGDSYNNPSPPDPTHLDNDVKTAVNVVGHYREGLWGGFVCDFPYMEIWNEPGSHFRAGQTMAQFNTFYVSTANALRSAFPNLKIGGPGWAPSGAAAPAGRATVAQFLDTVKAAGAPLDFMSWHVYSNDPAEYTAAADFYRSALDSRGLNQTESHITEWNTPTAEGDAGALRIGAKGAAINTAAWIALQESDVEVSTFYRGNDASPALPTFCGMFNADGTPKKTAPAFDLWSDMASCSLQRLLSITDGSGGDLRALAGEDALGNFALPISNLDAASCYYALSLDSALGLDLSQYRARLFIVSDAIPGIGQSPVDPRRVLIGGHEVHLVTLTVVPEPSAILLAGIAAVSLLIRRSRLPSWQ